jgi:hypothetical protein
MLPLSTRSKQDWRTPQYVLEYARNRFGHLSIDMAATKENAVVPEWCEGEDEKKPPHFSLWKQDFWCNPPFAQSKIWVTAALLAAEKGRTGTLLLRADLGAEYSLRLYEAGAVIVVLTPRVAYESSEKELTSPSFASMLVRTYRPFYRGSGKIEIVKLQPPGKRSRR